MNEYGLHSLTSCIYLLRHFNDELLFCFFQRKWSFCWLKSFILTSVFFFFFLIWIFFIFSFVKKFLSWQTDKCIYMCVYACVCVCIIYIYTKGQTNMPSDMRIAMKNYVFLRWFILLPSKGMDKLSLSSSLSYTHN